MGLSDTLSHIEQNHRIEFCIPNEILQPAIKMLVSYEIDIDLFASFLSKRFNRYCSFRADPFAVQCNTFLLNWADFNCYIHCPFSLIDRALKQIEDQKVKNCVFLAPLFHTAHWLPKLFEMSKQPPLLLPANTAKKLFLPWDKAVRHPVAKHMRMILADLCSTCFLETKFHQGQLITLRSMDGELHQFTDMPLARGVGSSFAKKRQWTNLN